MTLKMQYITVPIINAIMSILFILKRCFVENLRWIPLEIWFTLSSDAFFSLLYLIAFVSFSCFSFWECSCSTNANSTKATTTKNRLVSKYTPSAVNFPEDGLSFWNEKNRVEGLKLDMIYQNLDKVGFVISCFTCCAISTLVKVRNCVTSNATLAGIDVIEMRKLTSETTIMATHGR